MAVGTIFPTEHSAIEQFLEAMRGRDIDIDEPLIGDGKLHRYHAAGDRRGTRNAWALLHIDAHPAGTFGCNKRYGPGVKFPWRMKNGPELTADERRELKRVAHDREKERESEIALLQEQALQRAAWLYGRAQPVDIHPYLTSKGVQSNPRLRVGEWRYIDEDSGEDVVVATDALLIPIMDFAGNIHSIQAVLNDTDGGFRKQYLKNGAKEGHFISLAKPVHDTVLICEGLATGLSLTQCTGLAVLVAFDAGNLLYVAKVLRAVKPHFRIVLCADNDRWTIKPIANPGVHHARRAAGAVNGSVVYPEFKTTDTRPTDFNDLHQLEGELSVQQTIETALKAAADQFVNSGMLAGSRPQLLIAGGSRHLIVDRAEQIMATRDDLFSNARRLVRVAEAKDIGGDEGRETEDGQQNFTDPRRILMGSVAKEWLTTELTRDIEFVKSDGRKKDDGYINKDSPDWLAPALIEHKAWPNIRELAGITSAPILRRDGTVRVESGYDPQTGMLLIPRGAFLPVPEMPTHGDAVEALQVLKAPFKYYTFATNAGLTSALSIISQSWRDI